MRAYYIFADGSGGAWNVGDKTYKPGGWAFEVRSVDRDGVVQVHAAAFGSEADTTSNEMEVVALTQALRWLKDRNLLGQKVTFVTDSKNAIGWVSGEFSCSAENLVPLVKAAHQAWLDADAPRLKWVKGHAGNPGNEAVDHAAGQCRAKAQLSILAPLLTPECRASVQSIVNDYGVPAKFDIKKKKLNWSSISIGLVFKDQI